MLEDGRRAPQKQSHDFDAFGGLPTVTSVQLQAPHEVVLTF